MGLADSFMFLNKTHSLCVLCLILSSLRVPGVCLVFCPFFFFFFFFEVRYFQMLGKTSGLICCI
jgi:hypothetical protein